MLLSLVLVHQFARWFEQAPTFRVRGRAELLRARPCQRRHSARPGSQGGPCDRLARTQCPTREFIRASQFQLWGPPMSLTQTASTIDLFTPVNVGPLALNNRIVMAPLTRSRAGPGNVPTQLNALYYAQRASAGLIISEATQIAAEGQGYIATPGIHSPQQIEGWKCVTKAVHVANGQIVLQLWHVGRISHSSFQPGGAAPLAPSAIKPKGQAFTAKRIPADPNAACARNGRDSTSH